MTFSIRKKCPHCGLPNCFDEADLRLHTKTVLVSASMMTTAQTWDAACLRCGRSVPLSATRIPLKVQVKIPVFHHTPLDHH